MTNIVFSRDYAAFFAAKFETKIKEVLIVKKQVGSIITPDTAVGTKTMEKHFAQNLAELSVKILQTLLRFVLSIWKHPLREKASQEDNKTKGSFYMNPEQTLLLDQFKAEKDSRWGFNYYRGKRQLYFNDINKINIMASVFPVLHSGKDKVSPEDIKKSWLNKFIDQNIFEEYTTGRRNKFEVRHLIQMCCEKVSDYVDREFTKEITLVLEKYNQDEKEREERKRQQKKEADFARQVFQAGYENFSI